MQNVDAVLVFDGIDDSIEIPDSLDFSVATTGQATVSAWNRPDDLTFPVAQSPGTIDGLGKGEPGQQEWVLRMDNARTTDDPPRSNRSRFYGFNLAGGQGVGSNFHMTQSSRRGEQYQ
jgi:hypothetical protein